MNIFLILFYFKTYVIYDKVELSDYVEAKVRQMMDKEGVILDFSDSKLRGRIVTKTRIIKHVTG